MRKVKINLSQYQYYTILFLITLLLVTIQQLRFSFKDTRFIFPHDDCYAKECVNYYNYILAKDKTEYSSLVKESFLEKLEREERYLSDKYLAGIFILFDKSFFCFRLAFLPFFLLLLLAVYLLGNFLVEEGAGLFTVWVLLSSPVIISMSRKCCDKLFVAAFILLGVFFLVKSNGLTNFFYAVFLGVCCALSFSIHYSAVIYTAIIFFWIALILFKDQRKGAIFSLVLFYSLEIFFPLPKPALWLIVFFIVWRAYIKREALGNFIAVISITASGVHTNEFGRLFNHFIEPFINPAGITRDSKAVSLPAMLLKYLQTPSLFFLNSFYSGFLVLLFGWCLFYLYKRKPRHFFFTKHYYLLFLLFSVVSLSTIPLDYGGDTHIIALSGFGFFIASCILDNKYKIFRQLLFVFMGGYVLFINLYAMPTRNLLENPEYDAYFLYDKPTARTVLENFFASEPHPGLRNIGFFAPTYYFMFEGKRRFGNIQESLYYKFLDKVSLQILTPYPTEVKEIYKMKTLKKYLLNKELDYVILEQKKGWKNQRVMEETINLLAKHLKLYKNFNEEIFIFKREGI